MSTPQVQLAALLGRLVGHAVRGVVGSLQGQQRRQAEAEHLSALANGSPPPDGQCSECEQEAQRLREQAARAARTGRRRR